MPTWVMALVCFAGTALAAGREVEFRFAPPDGQECDDHARSVVVREGGAAGPRQESVTEGVTHTVYRRVAEGYEVTAVVRSTKMTVNGKSLEDPLATGIVGHAVTYDVTPEGVLRKITGLDELVGRIHQGAPAEVREMLVRVMGPEMIRSREEAEWKGRVTSFVGKKVAVGDVWEGTDESELPIGRVKFTSLTAFPKIEDRGERTWVTIRFAYGADGDAARAVLDQLLKGVAAGDGGGSARVGEVTIEGDGERVVDARTMLITSETIRRTIRFPLELPGAGTATVVRRETKTHRLECTPPAR